MTDKFSTQPRYRYYAADHAHRYARHVSERSWDQAIAAGDTNRGINWRPRPVASPRPAGMDRIPLLRDWRRAAAHDINRREGYGKTLQLVVSPVVLP